MGRLALTRSVLGGRISTRHFSRERHRHLLYPYPISHPMPPSRGGFLVWFCTWSFSPIMLSRRICCILVLIYRHDTLEGRGQASGQANFSISHISLLPFPPLEHQHTRLQVVHALDYGTGARPLVVVIPPSPLHCLFRFAGLHLLFLFGMMKHSACTPMQHGYGGARFHCHIPHIQIQRI